MEHTTPADYRSVILCPLSPRRTVDPISPFGRSLAQSLDSEGLTTLQVEWSDDLVDVCAARDIERLALVHGHLVETAETWASIWQVTTWAFDFGIAVILVLPSAHNSLVLFSCELNLR